MICTVPDVAAPYIGMCRRGGMRWLVWEYAGISLHISYASPTRCPVLTWGAPLPGEDSLQTARRSRAASDRWQRRCMSVDSEASSSIARPEPELLLSLLSLAQGLQQAFFLSFLCQNANQNAHLLAGTEKRGAQIADFEDLDEGSLQRVVNEVGRQLLECCRALEAAGIAHRDVKPDNLIVVDGRLRLIDFGSAAAMGLQ
eukprot:29941-Rhodomonas_salina.1